MKLVDANQLEWEDPPRGYYLTDVKQKVLWENKETGAMMVLVKFPEGIADKIHSHPRAGQFIYGLSGSIESDEELPLSVDGLFLHMLQGEKHGGTNMTEETILLFYWDGPPDVQIEE